MIRNFIYLDEQKMYSLSSQIFEGITEYVLNESSSSKEDTEKQKGPILSGRILADVINTSSRSTEKKFLHDYSFTLFEKYLLESDRVLKLFDPFISLEDLKGSIEKYSFIKIKAKAIFNDIVKITELYSSFNELGEAIAHLQVYERLEQIQLELGQATDNKIKSQLNLEYKHLSNYSKLAKTTNLYKDPKFLSDLSLLTKYGFSDQFEVQQFGGEALFTSCLKRSLLREQEDLLVKKYSRKTEKEIVVFGVITQAFSGSEPDTNIRSDLPNMRAGLMQLSELQTAMENSLSGKLPNEIFIDPVAVYFEL